MSKNAPDIPDPYAVSRAQSASNVATAQAQAKLGMTGQTTPTGTLNWVADPNSPSGYRAMTSLSPDQQGLLDATTGARTTAAGNVANALGTPFSLDASRSKVLTDVNQTLMDPMWAQREQSLQADLLNRGIRPGSDQWVNETRNFEDSRSRAYDQMFLDSYNNANQWALTEHNTPFTDAGAVFGLQQPTSPQWASTPAPGVAPTDVSGNVNQNYAIQQQAYNAQLAGMYGLPTAALGGWAMSGFKGAGKLAGLVGLG